MTCSMCAEHKTWGQRGETYRVKGNTVGRQGLLSMEVWVIIFKKSFMFALRMFHVFIKVPFACGILCRKTLKLFAFPVPSLIEQRKMWGLGQVRAGAWLRTKYWWWLLHGGSGMHADGQPTASPTCTKTQISRCLIMILKIFFTSL